MSNRVYFDLTDGRSSLRDEEGLYVSDRAEAIRGAQAVIEEARDSGQLSEDEEGWVMIIKDAAGDPLMTLPVVPRVPVMNS